MKTVTANLAAATKTKKVSDFPLNLYNIHGFNDRSDDVYLQVFSKGYANSGDAPDYNVQVGTKLGFDCPFYGAAMTNGCFIALSSTSETYTAVADTDTGHFTFEVEFEQQHVTEGTLVGDGHADVSYLEVCDGASPTAIIVKEIIVVTRDARFIHLIEHAYASFENGVTVPDYIYPTGDITPTAGVFKINFGNDGKRFTALTVVNSSTRLVSTLDTGDDSVIYAITKAA